jgi:hypothetical protein
MPPRAAGLPQVYRRPEDVPEALWCSFRFCSLHGMPLGGAVTRGPRGKQITVSDLPKHGTHSQVLLTISALPLRSARRRR